MVWCLADWYHVSWCKKYEAVLTRTCFFFSNIAVCTFVLFFLLSFVIYSYIISTCDIICGCSKFSGWADDPVWLKGGLPSLWSKKPFKYHALSGLPETVRSNFVNVNAFHADSLARSEKGVLVFQLEDSCRTSVMVLFDPNWQPFFWNTKISREIHVHYDGKSSLIFRIESTHMNIWNLQTQDFQEGTRSSQ